jgi:alpha-mannosidase
VHATRAPLKRLHAEAELSLERMAEPLAALALWRARRDLRPLLAHAWRTLLRSQFHDSIGGCTSDAVAQRVTLRLADAATSAGEIARLSLDSLMRNDPDAARDHPERTSPALVLFNPVPRARNGVVVTELSWFRRDVLVGPPQGGRVPRRADSPTEQELGSVLAGIPHQVLSRRSGTERLDATRHYPDQDEVDLFRVAIALPELGGFSIGRGVPRQRPAPVEVARGRLSNGLIEVALGREGLVELTDRRSGTRYRRLLALESEGDRGDTYSFAPSDSARAKPVAWSNPRIIARGPLVGALQLRTSLRSGAVRARLTLAVYAGSPLLRCTLDLENAVGDHRLRVRIPTGAGDVAVAGGAFSAIRRAWRSFDAARYPRETPVATAPAQRFVAVAGMRGGLAVLAPGFFEYEHQAGGDLLVTLLRCVGELSREDLPTRPGHAGWPTPTPGAQCLGRERVQLALAPVSAAELEQVAPVLELWEDAFVPPRAIWLRQATPLTPPAIDLELEGDGLVFSCLKPEEGDGGRIVFRCYNATGDPVEGRLLTDSPLESVERTRADEREGRPLVLEDGGAAVRFLAGPHEIVTLLLTP